MKRVRVLIVEDSPVVREHLRRIISSDPRLEVAGIAKSGEEAIEMVQQVAPDVVSMDIQLPGIQGFEATRQIMSIRPTPIVVVSGIEMHDMELSMQALRSGALSVVEKPVAATHDGYETIAGRLCTQLALMSEVKVVRQRNLQPRSPVSRLVTVPPPRSQHFLAVGIAASTGGPNALVQVLGGLQTGFSVPVAIVQHMAPGFINGFAEWLETVTPFRTHVVKERVKMVAGTVYIAPSGAHLALDGNVAMPEDSPPVGNHRPSANVLFTSMARTLGPLGIGIILTGMGDDGAAGLLSLKQAGGFTLAEAESTAIVYGMPAAAVKLGAVCETLPLPDIGSRVLELPVGAGEA